MYYNRNENGVSDEWVELMKNSITSIGGRYSTSRMLVDYITKLYMPLANLYNKYYQNLDVVTEFDSWKNSIYTSWEKVELIAENNLDNITIDAGNNIEVKCKLKLPNIAPENVEAQVYYGKIKENGVIEKIAVIPMKLYETDEVQSTFSYKAKIELTTGGDYGYTFRVMPKHEMLLDSENLNLIKWLVK